MVKDPKTNEPLPPKLLGPLETYDHSWIGRGLRFSCTGCGACCKNHSDNEYVYVTEADIQAIGLYLEMSRETFVGKYCFIEDGMYSFINEEPDCPFLVDNKCRIYPVRPKQCKTWPFWTENLKEEKWEGPVKACCPGIGKGPLKSVSEVLRIAAERDQWYGL